MSLERGDKGKRSATYGGLEKNLSLSSAEQGAKT